MGLCLFRNQIKLDCKPNLSYLSNLTENQLREWDRFCFLPCLPWPDALSCFLLHIIHIQGGCWTTSQATLAVLKRKLAVARSHGLVEIWQLRYCAFFLMAMTHVQLITCVSSCVLVTPFVSLFVFWFIVINRYGEMCTWTADFSVRQSCQK